MPANWQDPKVQFALTVLLMIIPWVFPSMGVKWRCFLWVCAWLLALHVFFSLVPWVDQRPLFVKIALATGLTGFLSAAAYSPVVDYWREEKASATTGILTPKRSNRREGDVVLQIGPNAKAWFHWKGAKNSPQFVGLGSYVQFDRNSDGDLIVNAEINDRDGNRLLDIVDNTWRVSNKVWDKNYTDDAIEIKDARGKVVFQLRLTERVEFQAEWWNRDGQGFRLVQVKDRPDAPDSDKRGFVIVVMTPQFHPDEPEIRPIFKYPATKFFGELR